ncbi:MAG: nucleotide exchange factor GrpE [Chloroflexi bacterium]|nr:MAG: nucleotide exchange factor GrpE [Chloroflexota bacterium]
METKAEKQTEEIIEKETTATDTEPVPVGAAESPEKLTAEEELQAEITRLQDALAEAETQAAQNLDGWQRAQAALENYRKRVRAEQEEWLSSANAELFVRLLPVLDDFERALANVPEEFAGHSWLDGLNLVRQKFLRLLEMEGVTVIETQPGQPFDPFYHEAILYQETPGFEDGQIVAQSQPGYQQGRRVLRPAMVMVAKAPAPPQLQPEPEDSPDAALETDTPASTGE